MCVHFIFRLFWLLSGHLLEIAVYSVDHMFSLYFDFVILVISHFDFEVWIRVLIASVPDLCMLFYFRNHIKQHYLCFAFEPI